MHALLPGPWGGGGGPDATLYTEDTPRREKEKKKRPIFACVWFRSFSCMLMAGQGREIVQAYNTVLLQYKMGGGEL